MQPKNTNDKYHSCVISQFAMADIISQRGSEKFVLDGYIYIFYRLSADEIRTFWRCEQKNSCKARIHTADGEIVNRLGEHTHEASAAGIEAKKTITRMKRRAVETVECTVQVINQSIVGIYMMTYFTKIATLKYIYNLYIIMHIFTSAFVMEASGQAVTNIFFCARKISLCHFDILM